MRLFKEQANWQDFWQEWRKKEVEQEDDLFFQVGLTINKKPIEKEAFDAINESIAEALSLNKNDVLIEFCCGNGLTTFELKDKVKQIIATDFSRHLIQAARRFKAADNISYNLGSVYEFLAHLKENGNSGANRYLMNNALGYFNPEELREIIVGVSEIAPGPFTFLLRGIPNDLKKWNYYNTEERKQRFLANQAGGDVTNEGMGRWWSPLEIQDICDELNLQFTLYEKDILMADFRMDVIISR